MVATLLAVALASAVQSPPVEVRRKALQAFLAEHWEYVLKHNPEFASILGDKRYNDQLSDLSEAAVRRDLDATAAFLARLQAIDTTGFPDQETLNKTLLVRRFSEELEGARFKDWEQPVSQFSGLHINAPQLVVVLPFDTVKDYEDYIARLRKLPVSFGQITDAMKKGMADGLMPPAILLQEVARQAAAIGAAKPSASPFFAPASRFPASIAEVDRARLRTQMLDAIEHAINPAYARFTAFVKDEYAPRGRAEPGLWALPDGDARYAYAIRQMTTTRLPPEQIHQIGLQEVARDRARMLQIAQQLGFKDLKSFEASIATNPALHPKSRQEILDTYRGHIDRMWAKLPQLFGRLPRAKVEVQPVETFREEKASGAEYKQGTPDGKRPGIIQVNTGDFQHRTWLDNETTAYHEGVPGHHLQISIAQELPSLPPFRQQAFYAGFQEGWALYSERLGEEVGFYQNPYSLYGHLQDDLLRAIRLVCDTGYHAKHWSRQQVVDYFHANSGIDEPTVQSETDRYMAWPAQALAYKVGQLQILELRARAQAKLGDRFDLRAFHDEVLGGGALPLDVLASRLEAWTASRVAPGGAVPGAPH